MPPAVRHLIAAAAGLAALPVIYYLTEAGARHLRLAFATFTPGVAGPACLAGVAALIAVMIAWPSLSPLAALVCGLPLAAAGVLFAAEFDYAQRLAARLPQIEAIAVTGEPPGTLAGATGLYVLAGGVLVVASLSPHRWLSLRGERTGP